MGMRFRETGWEGAIIVEGTCWRECPGGKLAPWGVSCHSPLCFLLQSASNGKLLSNCFLTCKMVWATKGETSGWGPRLALPKAATKGWYLCSSSQLLLPDAPQVIMVRANCWHANTSGQQLLSMQSSVTYMDNNINIQLQWRKSSCITWMLVLIVIISDM